MLNKKIIYYGLMLVVIWAGGLQAKIVLLTGGAGFIGSHVAQKLLDNNDTVINVDNFNDAYDRKLKARNVNQIFTHSALGRYYLYEVDIRDMSALDDIFARHVPDTICHLAARAGVRGSIDMPGEYFSSNIVGTLNIFELAKKYGVNHIVYASSSSVYGNCTQIPFTESFNITHPISPYAMTKCACELLAYTYFYVHGIASTGLRFFTVYGPRGRVDMAPFKFLDAIHKGKIFNVFGDGSAIRDFTYVEDIANGVVQALNNPSDFAVLNLGRGEPIVLGDFIEIIERIVGKKALISYQSKQQADVDMTHADISSARALIGYNPVTSVYDGMQRMYDWYLTQYLQIME